MEGVVGTRLEGEGAGEVRDPVLWGEGGFSALAIFLLGADDTTHLERRPVLQLVLGEIVDAAAGEADLDIAVVLEHEAGRWRHVAGPSK